MAEQQAINKSVHLPVPSFAGTELRSGRWAFFQWRRGMGWGG